MADETMNKVLYNIDQRPFTTEEQRETARNNIGAAAAGDFQVNAGNGIQVGANNTVSINSSGCYSVNTSLATGSGNNVYAPRSIVGGNSNQVNNANRDLLVVGTQNRPWNTVDSLFAGTNNWTNQVFYSVIAGEGGRISGGRCSLIMGSGTNGGTINNSMVACDGLAVDGTLNDSVVLGWYNHFSGTVQRNYVNGTNNYLTQEPVDSYARSCDYNIVNGGNNSLYNTNKVIVNGARNYVSGQSYDQTDGTIYTGDWNRGKNVRMSLVAGQQISAEGSFRSTFIGEQHDINGAYDSLVVGQGIVAGNTLMQSVVAGVSHSAQGSRHFITGRSNNVDGAEDHLVAGVENNVQGGNNDNVVGATNYSYYAYNSTVIGSANSAMNSYRSVIIGEANNVAGNDSVAVGNSLDVGTDETIRIGFGGPDTNCFLHITKTGISAVKDGSAVPII